MRFIKRVKSKGLNALPSGHVKFFFGDSTMIYLLTAVLTFGADRYAYLLTAALTFVADRYAIIIRGADIRC